MRAVAVLAFLSAGLTLAPAAHAAGVRSCSGALAAGSHHFTNAQVVGAQTYDVTTRSVSCSTAKAFIVREERVHRPFAKPRVQFEGYTCRTATVGEEVADTRCVRGANVIRWKFGA